MTLRPEGLPVVELLPMRLSSPLPPVIVSTPAPIAIPQKGGIQRFVIPNRGARRSRR